MNTPNDAATAKSCCQPHVSQPQRGDLTSAQGIALGRRHERRRAA